MSTNQVDVRQRIRRFPAVAGVYYCMALSLYPEAACEEVSTAGRVTRIRMVAMLLLVAAWVAQIQGTATFRWATLVFLLASGLVLGVPRRASSLLLLLVLAVVAAFGMDLVFRSFLDVILP